MRNYLYLLLRNYLFGFNSGKKLSWAIRNDVLVKLVRARIMDRICPFCGRRYLRIPNLITHLNSSSGCGVKMHEFIEATLRRYRLFSKFSLFNAGHKYGLMTE